MFKILIIIMIFTTIFIMPIPIKFYLFYDVNKLTLKIYNKNIKINSEELKKDSIKLNKVKKKKKIYSADIKTLWCILKKNKLKPSIKLNVNLNYGLDDAAVTAILFGLIYNFYSLIEWFFYSILKVKDMNFQLTPNYNKMLFILELNGIIYVSLVKIIFIYVILRKSYNKKTKDIEGGVVYG